MERALPIRRINNLYEWLLEYDAIVREMAEMDEQPNWLLGLLEEDERLDLTEIFPDTTAQGKTRQ